MKAMRKYRVISKWVCLFAVVPFLLFMAACSDCTSCKVAQPTASIPLCGAANVAVNSTVTATFSEAMEPSSINGTSFFVTGPGTTVVPGSVVYNGANNVANLHARQQPRIQHDIYYSHHFGGQKLSWRQCDW